MTDDQLTELTIKHNSHALDLETADRALRCLPKDESISKFT
jgi:hypothetical protein